MHAAATSTVSAPRPRRIGLVGGVDRTAVLYQRALAAIGCRLEHHTGHMAGRGADALASLVERVDLLIILTDVNSHNAVHAARRLAVARRVPHHLLRRCSPGRLAELVAGDAIVA